jgi:hypothetical protein
MFDMQVLVKNGKNTDVSGKIRITGIDPADFGNPETEKSVDLKANSETIFSFNGFIFQGDLAGDALWRIKADLTYTYNSINYSNSASKNIVIKDVGGQTHTQYCTDTDNGLTYNTKGKCTDNLMYKDGFNDFCTSSTKLVEIYCSNDECAQQEHNCNCAEGRCVESAQSSVSSISLPSVTITAPGRNVTTSKTFTVKNTGDTTISDISITTDADSKYNVQFSNVPSTLSVGQSSTIAVKVYTPAGESLSEHRIGGIIFNSNSITASSELKLNVQESEAPSGTCTDTDNGKVYTLKGTCTDNAAYSAGFHDFCSSNTKLVEMYCKEGQCVQEEHSCVCVEGACS